MKRANKDEQSAELVEGRGSTKGNTGQTATHRTQSRGSVSSGLAGVRGAARRDKEVQFTALLHHVSPKLLEDSYKVLNPKAASGVDGITWKEYGEGLKERLADLHARVHRGSYRAQPSKRQYIAKEDGRKRPLGIPALEDKIVQQAVGRVLEQIYEEDFLGFSYGFRPGRSPHHALDALWMGITTRRINWVLDADIEGFFETISHEWMRRFLEHRVGDRRVLRLIRKWLRAGVSEAGQWSKTREGTPQGAVISPLLANIFLHYVLDLWVESWRRKKACGDVIIVRYADDFVVGFEHRREAERFWKELEKRLEQFGLRLNRDKSRLIEFGRYALENRRRGGLKRPESFCFLGFRHICGKTKRGGFTIRRKTKGQRLRRSIQKVRVRLRWRRQDPLLEQAKWLRAVVQGFLNYYAVPGNSAAPNSFRTAVIRSWMQALRRRSQKDRFSWDRLNRYVRRWIPSVRIVHPYPSGRFLVTHPR